MSARTLSHRKAVSNSEPQGACAPPRAALVLATPLMEPPASARGGARCTAEARAANRPSQRLQEGPQHSARGRARRARRSTPRRTQRRFRASDPAFRSVCARPEGPWGRPHTRQGRPHEPIEPPRARSARSERLSSSRVRRSHRNTQRIVSHAHGSEKREHNRFVPFLAPSESCHEAGTMPLGVARAPRTLKRPQESYVHVIASARITAESNGGNGRFARAPHRRWPA